MRSLLETLRTAGLFRGQKADAARKASCDPYHQNTFHRCIPIGRSALQELKSASRSSVALLCLRREIVTFMIARLSRAARLLVCLLTAISAVSGSALAQSTARVARCSDSLRVRGISYDGNPKFPAVLMSELIVNETPSFTDRLVRRARYLCVDTLEVQRDALRLAVLHRQRGWFLANVTPRYTRKSDGVRVTFDVNAGPEAKIDSIAIVGLPPVDEGARNYGAPLVALKGERFDRVLVQALADTVVERLRNAGYARAVPPVPTVAIDTASATDSTDAKVRLSFSFTPGERFRLSEVHVRVQGIDNRRTVDSADVMALIRLRSGQRYRVDNITQAQRDLYRTDAFRLVLIDTIPPRVGSKDSLFDLQVTVAEAKTRYARAGAGWATQDCGRVQARLQDRAFLAPGRRAELAIRASKIGVGEPLDIAEQMCSSIVRNDPFSKQLNYYFGTTISNTRFFGRPFAPTFTIYSERRSEPLAYLRETYVGSLFEVSSTRWRRTVITPGVQYELGQTKADPAVLCSRFLICEAQTSERALFGRAVTVFNTSLTHDRSNNAVDPTYGSRYRAQVRAGLTSSSNDQQISFFRTTGEASAYRGFLGGTFATRLQISRVFTPNVPVVNGAPLIPQQERLFAGGQSSVRGFGQNLLGPLVYVLKKDSAAVVAVETRPDGQQYLVVKDSSAVEPIARGGTAFVVGNIEWRRRVSWPTNKLQVALFADAGTIWETNAQEFNWRDVRVTPGIGARLDTPLGPFRIDLGYNPYEQRAGRVLLFTGETTQSGSRGAVRCVTPGNTIVVGPIAPQAFDLSKCPETFRPKARDVLGRIVFHFSLGQAF